VFLLFLFLKDVSKWSQAGKGGGGEGGGGKVTCNSFRSPELPSGFLHMLTGGFPGL